MPLGTLDPNPPPFFRQGPSALTKLAFCTSLAVLLMVADARFKMVGQLRSAVASVLLPVERALLVPVRAFQDLGDYGQGLQQAVSAEAKARRTLTEQALLVAQVAPLRAENERLRALLDLKPTMAVKSMAAEVLFEAPDPYARRVIINRGATQGVRAGAPVVNERGVIGQVTRVHPLSSEVTLLTDRDAAIPVLNVRTQARGVAYGAANHVASGESDLMEQRFVAANADVQVGDELTTSGMDGVYPAGLKVAQVQAVDRKADTGFAKVWLKPAAPADMVHHVLILDTGATP